MTTFISYSRINSDFTVQLTKDLKEADFDVWLDQLDIPTGARWDDEIERALEACSTFLIILSPESIQSQNVKDEIGYAIDTGKQILPVVIENCKVPFRLRRFQYVDFTDQPYKDSLVKIKYLLGNIKELEKTAKDIFDDGTLEGQDQIRSEQVGSVVPNESAPRPAPEKTQRFNSVTFNRKGIPQIALGLFGISVLVLVFVFRDGFVKSGSTQTDDSINPISSPAPTETLTQVAFTATLTPLPPSKTPTAPPSATLTLTPLPDEIMDAVGVQMRLVSAGELNMGDDGDEPDEGPLHHVYLDSFYIDKYEVTNSAYSACVSEGKCIAPKRTNSFKNPSYYGNTQFDNFPVIYVDWYMAKAYCEWRGARLPTESEWEKAARGTDGSTYPWGEDIGCNRANYGGCLGDTNMVGGYEISPSDYGVYDMAGNVWEWVADWYSADYYKISPAGNPTGPASGVDKVLRGGSWADLGSSSRSANRHNNIPLSYGNSVGIRCARDANP